jgi:toxin ParE1/3/4
VKLRYTRRAQRHLDNIHSYIHERSPASATRVIGRIRYRIGFLLDFPLMGPRGHVEGTRELVVVGLPYVVVYRLAKDDPGTVEGLGVYHGAQDRAQDEFTSD